MRPFHPRTTTFAAVLLATASLALPVVAASGASPATAMPSASPDGSDSSGTVAQKKLPRFDHVLLVVFENKKRASIIGNPDAPYFNELASGGANFKRSYAVTHPSQPNYLALFSGSTQGVIDDSCPHTFDVDNEASELMQAGFTFTSYSEDLPAAGSKVCTSGDYARKHAPWTNFPNVPDASEQPYTSFPSDYSQLPDVSWVIPNLCDDMHDCSIATGDSWLQSHLGGYAEWAKANNSLLIVTFDEDDRTAGNQIATIFYGAHVKVGSYGTRITHYSVLRTIEDMYGVPRLGAAASAKPIKKIWN